MTLLTRLRFLLVKPALSVGASPNRSMKWIAPTLMGLGAVVCNGNPALASTTTQPAHRAVEFAGNLGVGVHVGATSGPYSNITAVINAVRYIGVTHVRDSMETNSWGVGRLRQLSAIGVKWDVVLKQPPSYYQPWLDSIVNILDSVEGPNEVDYSPFSYGGLSGVQGAALLQHLIYSQMKADPILANVPVLNFTVYDFTHSAAAGNLSGYADYGNLHLYPRPYDIPNAPPGTPQGQYPVSMSGTVDVPGKPIVVTETGFSTITANSVNGAIWGVSENVQAKYLLNDLLDNYRGGTARTYIYELLDEVVDPAQTNIEYHFGLFRSDYTPKPAALGIHNLTQILSDTASTSKTFPPTSLTYSVADTASSNPIDFSQTSCLFQKANGRFYLVIWNEPTLWQKSPLQELPPPAPHTVALTLAAAPTSVNVYDPLTAASPIAGYTKQSQVTIPVSDHPMVVEIVP